MIAENKKTEIAKYKATRNACKLCAPLGASVAFKGIRGCVPLIHGSQGCSTYIRRYMISHYKEPVDIASTNFTEDAAIYGGQVNFEVAVDNLTKQYAPEIIAIASTCLSETIGDNMDAIIKKYRKNTPMEGNPKLVHASTPSYSGSHMEGFHAAVLSLVKTFAKKGSKTDTINLLPGFVSPGDIRNLKEIVQTFELKGIYLPDYSEVLDNPGWDTYKRIPEGGTGIEELELCGSSIVSIEFGYTVKQQNKTPAAYLEDALGVSRIAMDTPIGIKATDAFFKILQNITGKPIPVKYEKERGRLVDAYVDGHKHNFGKKAIVYGEPDLVMGLASFLSETGIEVIALATGSKTGAIEKFVKQEDMFPTTPEIMEGADFEEIRSKAKTLKPDLLIGNSKGYYISRELNIPIVRVGFPIHDRVGGQRIEHLFYSGTHDLFDRITNTIIETKQNQSPVGYKYM